MTSAKSYARAVLAATSALDAAERLAWLMVLKDRSVQRVMTRVLQERDPSAAFAKLAVPSPIARFLLVLAEDRALHRLGTIAEQALTLIVAVGDGVPVRLITATPVSDTVRTQIAQELTQGADGPVIVDTHVDPRALGGFRIELGENRLDQTVSARLAALQRALATSEPQAKSGR